MVTKKKIRIQWLINQQLQIIADENTTKMQIYEEDVLAGEKDDIIIMEDNGRNVTMKFACGDICNHVQKDWFEVVAA